MKIVVIGSGGTGGFFGAKLAKAGEDVTFVARGAHLQEMREHGLTIRSKIEGEWTIPVKAVDHLADHDFADIILFCVKSWDTETAAELAKPVMGPNTGLISIQNGIDNEDKLIKILGPSHVMGGICYVFSNIIEPGVIAHHQFGRIVFGEMDGRISERATAFSAACENAAIPVECSDHIRRTLWEKYLVLAPLAGTTCITRLPVKFIRELAATRRLWQQQTEELIALARAMEIDLGEDRMSQCLEFLESLGPNNYSSMCLDLLNDKPLELEALIGHAVRLGQRHAVPTPTLAVVYGALLPYLKGKPTL
jgi:2-dehydropantoate 2-reductase